MKVIVAAIDRGDSRIGNRSTGSQKDHRADHRACEKGDAPRPVTRKRRDDAGHNAGHSRDAAIEQHQQNRRYAYQDTACQRHPWREFCFHCCFPPESSRFLAMASLRLIHIYISDIPYSRGYMYLLDLNSHAKKAPRLRRFSST
jgi:hypothetical protein